MSTFQIHLADMSRQELDDHRTLLLKTLGQQHATRRLMIEDEFEGDDSDLRLDLQDERQNYLSPRTFSRSLFEPRNANDDLMKMLAHARDDRIPHLPSLKELLSLDC